MTDGVHQNGATGKNMKRYRPVKNVFHSKFKARLSWIIALLKIFAVEFNCVGNHFLEEIFSERFDVFKMTPFRYFAVILSLL